MRGIAGLAVHGATKRMDSYGGLTHIALLRCIRFWGTMNSTNIHAFWKKDSSYFSGNYFECKDTNFVDVWPGNQRPVSNGSTTKARKGNLGRPDTRGPDSAQARRRILGALNPMAPWLPLLENRVHRASRRRCLRRQLSKVNSCMPSAKAPALRRSHRPACAEQAVMRSCRWQAMVWAV